MIAIIAEKPSVGQEIARVVGATEKKDGYITGNGYYNRQIKKFPTEKQNVSLKHILT